MRGLAPVRGFADIQRRALSHPYQPTEHRFRACSPGLSLALACEGNECCLKRVFGIGALCEGAAARRPDSGPVARNERCERGLIATVGEGREELLIAPLVVPERGHVADTMSKS